MRHFLRGGNRNEIGDKELFWKSKYKWTEMFFVCGPSKRIESLKVSAMQIKVDSKKHRRRRKRRKLWEKRQKFWNYAQRQEREAICISEFIREISFAHLSFLKSILQLQSISPFSARDLPKNNSPALSINCELKLSTEIHFSIPKNRSATGFL